MPAPIVVDGVMYITTSYNHVYAVDAVTGKQKWKTYTITEKLVKTGVNSAGATNWGPSGAPIWNLSGFWSNAPSIANRSAFAENAL